MSLTNYAIKNKAVSWMFSALLLIGGLLAFTGLGRLEDPEFTIKQAVIVTQYPGASALEVEEEITLPIETALQQLPYLDNVTSVSSSGLSQVTVEMKDIYRKKDLVQIWDEMRRKIRDMQGTLPKGSYPPNINDDFSDVYGMFFAITGEGYSQEELGDYADILRRELVLVDGVGKVAIGGRLQKQIVLEVNRNKLTSLNLSVGALQQLLQSQNLISNAGEIQLGSENIRIASTGKHNQTDQLHDLMLGQAKGQIIYLSDVADISVTFADPPRHIYRFNGQDAITLGISFASGVNVVEVGKAVKQRLTELEYARPVGVDFNVIYDQPERVDRSVDEFLISLAQAVAIVIVVLLLTMGIRSGILMSGILLLTILGTFIIMNIANIDLHGVSLGALIISLGLLVDNAIVITDGILIGLKRGLTKIEAAKRTVSHTTWPLLGATIIAVTAFAPIGLSPDSTGEFTSAIFWVLLISLMISWLLAITLTPFFASLLFSELTEEEKKAALGSEEKADPYRGFAYQIYRGILLFALRFRWLTAGLTIGALTAAIYGFGFVTQAFFPPSNLPAFTVDFWLPQGSDIRSTIKDMSKLEESLLEDPDIRQITSTIGTGSERFMLNYIAERSFPSYGQYIIEIHDFDKMSVIMQRVLNEISARAPQAFVKVAQFEQGKATKAKIEARITGPDRAVLRQLAEKVKAIYRTENHVSNIRHDWRERTKVLLPQFAEAEARRLGVSKSDIDKALLLNVKGVEIAKLRDGADTLPIILRPPYEERSSIEQLGDIQVFSPALNRYVNIDQVVHSIDLGWEDSLIMRRDRKRTIQVWVDPTPNSPVSSLQLFANLRPKVEALELPTGYELSWGGEYESEHKANVAVFQFVPLGIVVMLSITVMLFNSFRQTIVVWLTVPLAVVGVTPGLLLFDQPFSFSALLGFLSLSGMILKNGIVLIEEIKRLNEEEGMNMQSSITQASVSRMRPVTMAAVTTVLGLIPLLTDVFFAPLAVTIMFGLGFATILTLIVLPVLFAIFYGISYRRAAT